MLGQKGQKAAVSEKIAMIYNHPKTCFLFDMQFSMCSSGTKLWPKALEKGNLVAGQFCTLTKHSAGLILLKV